jgi:hypothetical protein
MSNSGLDQEPFDSEDTPLPDSKVIVAADGTQYAVGEIRHSRRISKSVTPKGDVTWYVKWISSIIVLGAIAIRASGVAELQWLDILLSLIGAVGWLFVSLKWNDRAMILLHSVITVMLGIGLLRVWFVV